MSTPPSIAAQILDVIERAAAPINTTDIYGQVDAAENITIVSVTCRDLLLAHKVDRIQISGRWHYQARQLDLLGPSVAPGADVDVEPSRGIESPEGLRQPAPARRSPAHRLGGRRLGTAARSAAGVGRDLKLRTLDKLIALLADDIAGVLRAVRDDVEGIA